MVAGQDHAIAIRDWLGTVDGYDYLQRFVGKVMQFDRAVRAGEGAGPDGLAGLSHEERTIAVQDLTHDFLLYLLDTFLPGAGKNPDLLNLLVIGQYRRLLELAWGRFTWHHKEQARKKALNPRGYLYRRLRQLLAADSRFTIIEDRRGLRCYLPARKTSGRSDDIQEYPDSLETGGYTSWPAPPAPRGQKPEAYLFSSVWLLATAQLFYREAVSRVDGPLAVPIRELSRYLADHHPWLNTPRQESKDQDDWLDTLVDPRENTEERVHHITAMRSMGGLAVQLAATWTEEQCRVFVLHLDEPQPTFREIADRLGYVDHNRPYALLQQTKKSLQRFIGTWPGPPLSELSREVAETFVEELKQCCQKTGWSDRKER